MEINLNISKSIRVEWAKKKVTIFYKDQKVTLQGTYETAEEGMRAARKYCRDQGWSE
jgi:hypothetical protein